VHGTAERQAIEPRAARGHIAGMSEKENEQTETVSHGPAEKPPEPVTRPKEIGGPKGPEPTRYGDWEVGGRCTDF
jgi:hypothetical protein